MILRLLLVDDHPVVRDGLRAYFSGVPSVQVVGEAGDGLEAVRLAREASPDVMLLDLSMPRLGGIETIRELRHAAPRTRVLVLTMQEDAEYVREARRAGAHGYLVKDASPADLLRAIEAVHSGDPFHTSGTSQALVDAPGPEEPALSPRERDVLRLLVEGLTSREIARSLDLGVRTVESHRLRLRRKLGMDSVAELTRYALARGLLRLP